MRSTLYRRLAVASALGLLATSCVSRAPVGPPGPRGGISIGAPPIDRLDPAVASTPEQLLVLRTACDGLTSLDHETGQPSPALAASWTISKDGLKVTFRLRNGIRFQDGTPVTARDVRRALLQVLEPERASPWAPLLTAVAGAGTPAVEDSIEAVGDRELTITLSRPAPDLVAAVAHPAMVPTSARAGHGLPVCSGPYRITEIADGGVRLVHAGGPAGDGYLSLIRFIPFASEEEAFDAFKAETLQVSPVPVNRVIEAEAMGRSYTRGSTSAVTYLSFTPGDPATSDVRVRQAISLAVDRLLLIDAAFGDQREPAVRWLSASERQGTCSTGARRVSDPDAAKAMMAATGIDPASIQLKLTYDQGSFTKPVAQAIEVKIEDVLGIKVTADPFPPDVFRQAVATREHGRLWLIAHQPQVPTVGEMLSSLFHSSGRRNATGMSDPTVDAALEEAESQTSHKGREAKGVEAEELICEKVLGIPLWWGVRHWVIDEAKTRSRARSKLDLFGEPILREVSLR